MSKRSLLLSFLAICGVMLFGITIHLTKNIKNYSKSRAIGADNNIDSVIRNTQRAIRESVNGSRYNAEKFDFRIIVIVFNRHRALQRLLVSLNEALYVGDNVKLEVWIDRSVSDVVDFATLSTANKFTFTHGTYEVIVRQGHVGIYGQWLASVPISDSDHEISVILEDDLTVSKFFYKYLKIVHAKYDRYPNINGYSLQSVSMKHAFDGDGGLLEAPSEHNFFLYPVLGTWGFSPNMYNWRKFINWFLDLSKNGSLIVPHIDGNIVSHWYDEFKNTGKLYTFWEVWHVYYSHINSECTLYSNFEGHRGLSTNWKEKGLHYSGADTGPSNRLLTEWKPEYEVLPDNPVMLDLRGNITFQCNFV